MIVVTGGSRTQRKFAKSIAEFCVAKLMPKMLNLDIEIVIKSFGKDSNYGYCCPNDFGECPREFEIEVNKAMRLRRLLETIAHEMVHVKQFAKGELYESTRLGKHRWQGQWIDNDPEYWDRPWEIEAHGRECGLFVRWAESQGLGHKKWTKDQ